MRLFPSFAPDVNDSLFVVLPEWGARQRQFHNIRSIDELQRVGRFQLKRKLCCKGLSPAINISILTKLLPKNNVFSFGNRSPKLNSFM